LAVALVLSVLAFVILVSYAAPVAVWHSDDQSRAALPATIQENPELAFLQRFAISPVGVSGTVRLAANPELAIYWRHAAAASSSRAPGHPAASHKQSGLQQYFVQDTHSTLTSHLAENPESETASRGAGPAWLAENPELSLAHRYGLGPH
jgi:hypothetical protein